MSQSSFQVLNVFSAPGFTLHVSASGCQSEESCFLIRFHQDHQQWGLSRERLFELGSVSSRFFLRTMQVLTSIRLEGLVPIIPKNTYRSSKPSYVYIYLCQCLKLSVFSLCHIVRIKESGSVVGVELFKTWSFGVQLKVCCDIELLYFVVFCICHSTEI